MVDRAKNTVKKELGNKGTHKGKSKGMKKGYDKQQPAARPRRLTFSYR